MYSFVASQLLATTHCPTRAWIETDIHRPAVGSCRFGSAMGRHETGSFTRVGQLRNRIISVADECHVLKESEPKTVASELLELFSTRADRILYASMAEWNKDANRLRYKRHRAKTHQVKFQTHQCLNPRSMNLGLSLTALFCINIAADWIEIRVEIDRVILWKQMIRR